MGVTEHHHRSTTKSKHQPFKSRHATKSEIRNANKGKVEKSFGPGAKSRHQQVMSKIDRRHQARQHRLVKHKEHMNSTNIFNGQKGAPRIVAVVPLSSDVDAVAAVKGLNASLEIDVELQSGCPTVVEIDRFKQKLQYIPTTYDLFSILDACRVADFAVFVLSAHEEVDDHGELLLKSIESQGVSNVVTVVQGLDSIENIKQRSQATVSLKTFITHYFPTQEKVHSLDSAQECTNVLRSICTATPRGIRWREERSWLLSEELQWIDPSGPEQEAGTLILRGIVRGRNLNANRLLQIGDYGAFQIEKIVTAPPLRGKKRKVDDLKADEELNVLQVPDATQDDLNALGPEEIQMSNADDGIAYEAPSERKGVLLDDHRYFSDEEFEAAAKPKRLPRGTSAYQAAWYHDEMSDSDSDLESIGEDGEDFKPDIINARPEDGLEGLDNVTMKDATEGAPSEYPQSEMFVDRSLDEEAEELAAFRQSKKSDAKEDLEFPDEIELQPNVLASDRLARYRGLKSLRTSKWDTSEDIGHEPEEWNRLFQPSDYRGIRSKVTREALVGGIQPGVRVEIHVRRVPVAIKESILEAKAITAFSLLRHENKRVVANYSMTLSSDYPAPLRSKEALVVQCGPRRFMINPLFSSAGTTPNNVHKNDRYLHPGRNCMSTFIAPLTWGSVPLLFFKAKTSGSTTSASENLELIGTGTSQAPDQSRVIAKRVILTGHPYKIHKKLVTIRYMFFNAEDVRWFKALQLWTKRGRSGFIKESLGTHGYFKATFDAKINPQDSIGISLYKRVFPKSSRPWARDTSAEPAPNLVSGGSVVPGERMEE